MWQQTAFIIAFCLLQKIFALLLSKRIALFLSFKKLFFSFLLLLNVRVWFKFEITQDSPFRKFLEIYFLMLCVDCDTHMSGHPVHAWCLWRPEEGIGCPWIGISYCCKLPRECWTWNTEPLQGPQVLSTAESTDMSSGVSFWYLWTKK